MGLEKFIYTRVERAVIVAAFSGSVLACGGTTTTEAEPPVVEDEVFAAQSVSLAAASAVALFEPFVAGDENVMSQLANVQGMSPELGVILLAISDSTGPCASFSWSSEDLLSEVEFQECDFEQPGLVVNGRMVLRLKLEPPGFDLELDGIRVDDVALDGNLTLTPTGDGSALSGDVSFERNGQIVDIGLNELVVSLFEGGASIRGGVRLSSPAFSGRSSTSGLVLASGECTPRGGSIELGLEDREPVSLTYLFTTPADGRVDLLAGGRVFQAQPLLEPCN